MRGMQPWKLIVIGFMLVLFGFVAPFLMVIRVVESSLILSFLSYGASVVGLFLGLIGAALYVRIHRN
jgi:hypothetical protein